MEEQNRKRVVLGTEVVKTTRAHTCWGCGNQIPPGNKIFGTKIHDEDADWTCYWCDVCGVYMDRHKPDPRYYDGIAFKGIIKTDREGWHKIKEALEHVAKSKQKK